MRSPGSWGEKSLSIPATSVTVGSDGPKAAVGVTTVLLPEVMPEQAGRRSVGVSAAYREMIELELSRGRNALGIWQCLVDEHGVSGG